MSLTFSTALLNALLKKDVKLDFAYKFFYDDATGAKYLGLCGGSDRKLYAGSVPAGAPNIFYGLVQDHGEIVQTLDLARSKASVQNVTITCVNKLKNTTLAAELFQGTRKYINHLVKIYLIHDSTEDLTSGCLVGNFRLVNINANLETVTLDLEEWSPFDDIVIPNTKTQRNIYLPVCYGNYDQQDHTEFSQYGYYHPVPVLGVSNNHIYCGNHQNEATNTKLAVYVPDWDVFGTCINANAAVGSNLLADQDLEYSYKVRPKSVNAASEFVSDENAIDDDGEGVPATAAQSIVDLSDTGLGALSASDDEDLILDFGGVGIGVVTAFKVNVNYEAHLTVASTLVGTPVGGNTLSDISYAQTPDVIVTMGQSGDGTNTDVQADGTEIELEDHYDDTNTPPSTLIIRHAVTLSGTGLDAGAEMTVHSHYYIYDVWAEVTQKLDFTNEPDAAYKTLADMKYLYSAAEGYSQGFNGGSGLADDVHEAHRDIMYRFAGVDYADTYMKNWTGGGGGTVAGQRAGWGVRLWILEPTPLKDVLEQLQFEGAFIFRLVADSDGSGNAGGHYILIKNSYDSSDVTYTLTNADFADLQLSITPLSELVTKTTYNFNRHPAEHRYIESDPLTNSTARTSWNIATNENAVEVDLDYLIDCNNSPNTVYDSVGDTNPNDSIATYYDNINANPRIMASCAVVNPSKFKLDLGDIVQFSDTNILPFGETWATLYFMIVETCRTPNSLQIVCREVYNS